MVALGISYALLSGICNGLFTTPMKLIPRWKWENTWLVFIVTACVFMPALVVFATVPDYAQLLAHSPRSAVASALSFGFAWGFGAILFGLTVDRLGISLANSMVIGLSSAMGSLVPLILQGALGLEMRHVVLYLGIVTFLAGITLCGAAGRIRDRQAAAEPDSPKPPISGYLFAIGAGVMSAVFNIGYSLALPIADAGERLGHSRFLATNCIWLLMLGAGSIPNMAFCGHLLRKNRTTGLFLASQPYKPWGFGILMGLLWGGSIFLYGTATPLLGDIGPSIGWPLSLAVALLVANSSGFLLGEWRAAGVEAVRKMRLGILTLIGAIVLCALSSGL